MPGFTGAVLVGSVARREADRFSDVDLLLFVADGSFAAAWAARRMLRPPLSLAWDLIANDRGPGAHKWIGSDLIMVECLIGETSQIHVAEPFVQVVGAPDLVERLRRRSPIERREMTGPSHPIERWYDRVRLWARATFGRS